MRFVNRFSCNAALVLLSAGGVCAGDAGDRKSDCRGRDYCAGVAGEDRCRGGEAGADGEGRQVRPRGQGDARGLPGRR